MSLLASGKGDRQRMQAGRHAVESLWGDESRGVGVAPAAGCNDCDVPAISASELAVDLLVDRDYGGMADHQQAAFAREL